jgi:hypothetical protein
MFLLRLLLKLILLPVMLAVTLLQWIGIFLTGFSSVIFYILSGIVFLTAILSWAFQIAPGAEVFLRASGHQPGAHHPSRPRRFSHGG